MLYLISNNKYLKIGYSNNIKQRMSSYATHNPEIELLAIRQGSKISERYFHILLSKYKINKTEWMKYDDFIIECFKKLSLKDLDEEVISDDIEFCKEIEHSSNKILALSKSESNIFLYIKTYYNNEKIVVNKFIRDDIINKTGLAESTVKNAFTSLVKKGILEKLEMGIYLCKE